MLFYKGALPREVEMARQAEKKKGCVCSQTGGAVV